MLNTDNFFRIFALKLLIMIIANPIYDVVKRLSKAASNEKIKKTMDAEDMIERLVNREAEEKLKIQAKEFEEKFKEQASLFEKEREQFERENQAAIEEKERENQELKRQIEELKNK
jgi:formate-dependent nitrite reductase cytochrome c552 subunit